jgi:mannose-1-phosphate guanylyltransferase
MTPAARGVGRVPALLLTAGLGTRLDPLTRLVAKPAMPMFGQSLVERGIAWLAREGVADVVLNLHFRPESIAAIVGDGSHLGVRTRSSWETRILGSAGGPRHAWPLLASDVAFIVNGDTLCDVALDPMLDAHYASGADVTMAVIANPHPDRYNGIAADGSGRVTGFVPKGQAEGTWHFVGVQVANRSVFAGLPDATPMETVAGIYREMVATSSGRLHVWPVTTAFLDIGTPSDYLEATLALAAAATSPAANAIEPGATIDPTARLHRCVVWPQARIAAGTDLSNCIVAGAVTVPSGYKTENAVVLPASLVRPADSAAIVHGAGVFGLNCQP